MKKLIVLIFCSTACLGSQSNSSSSSSSSSSSRSSGGSISFPSSLSKDVTAAVNLTEAIKALKLQESVQELGRSLKEAVANIQLKDSIEALKLKEAIESLSKSFHESLTNLGKEVATALPKTTEALKIQEFSASLEKSTANIHRALADLGKGIDVNQIRLATGEVSKILAETAQNMTQQLSKTTDKAVKKIVEQTAASIKQLADAFNFENLKKIKAHIAIDRKDAINGGAAGLAIVSGGSIACHGLSCSACCILAGSMVVLYPDKSNEIAKKLRIASKNTYRAAVQQWPGLGCCGDALNACTKMFEPDFNSLTHVKPLSPLSSPARVTEGDSLLALAPPALPSSIDKEGSMAQSLEYKKKD